ncbi:restriction endonuclease subunit S [Fusobacterium hwasookii]|uniref:restriction endonuclease subunit S n=1 Tax=Fusobacterium hwasookii TaxID=1583098 RepID=UPI001627EA56|nr:restriction endonuclease subunit S [Fusobacterium hwasookii]QNE69352.1 restriction endonuclease subunit S [Fusobacterium hwasookii]
MNKNIQYKKLTDICEVITGEWGTEISENSQNIVSVIRTTNFLNNGKIDIENKELIKRDIEKNKIEQKQLKKGDIIIEKSGGSPNQPVGRVVFFSLNSNEILLCNNFTSILRIKGNINSKYVFYFLRNSYKNKKVLKFQNKTTGIINLKLQNYLDGNHIFLPELKIQNKIVSILDNLENIIEKNQNYLIHLRELTKSLFIRMFGDPLTNDRIEWKFSKIKNIGKIISGSTPNTNTPELWNGDYLWITPAELKDDSFIVNSTERKLTYLGIKNSSLIEMPIGTVLLSSRAPIGKVAIVGKNMFCNQGFKNIIPNEEINSIYLYYILKEKKEYLNFLGRGATFKELSKEIVENISLKIPPIELQNKFAERVEKIEKLKFTIWKIILKVYETLKKKGVESN